MNETNELLRSAHEIAKRKGDNTNWAAFERNLLMELLKQAGVPDDAIPNEQIILRCTVTPKTYRLPDDENVSGILLIEKERERQYDVEGFTVDHDAQWTHGELGAAAASYLSEDPSQWWPWDMKWWKPLDRIRNLVKAGALIAAEIDRLIAISV